MMNIGKVTSLRYSTPTGKKQIGLNQILVENSIGSSQCKKKQMQGVLGPSWACSCFHLTASPTLHWVSPFVIPRKGVDRSDRAWSDLL